MLDRKLSTSKGAELRDELIARGLMDRVTQQPIRPSDRLLPLLIECGIIDSETHERIDTAAEEEIEEADEEQFNDEETTSEEKQALT